MKSGNSLLSSYGTTIFEVMSRLAVEHGAINLGQGFPDDRGPDPVLEEASKFLFDPPNQYPPMLGVPELRQAVAEHNKRFYDIDVDWQKNTMVSTGATEGLAACFFGLIEPGDEVVVIEPLYDCYLPIIRRAGATVKSVKFVPPEWKLDFDALESAFSEKTKLILINDPQNPASKVYSREELEFIAGLVQKYDAYAVCDEVYEHMTFDERKHIPLMTFDGMKDRCVRIGSAGKTFSLTGWKVGYLTGPEHLLQPIIKAHQFLVFTTAPNLQRAVAFGLRQDDSYFEGLQTDMQRRRDRLSAGIETLGLPIATCAGSYFLFVDVSGHFREGESDVEFCQRLVTEGGIASVPVSGFYQDKDTAPKNFIRFCFAKQDAVIDAALEKLTNYLGS